MKKNIFFDFDGVILESLSVKGQAFYELYLPFGETIASRVRTHHFENGGISRFDKIRFYHKEFLKKKISETELQAFCHKFSNLVFKKILGAEEVLGIRDFLMRNKKEKKYWIVSATPQEEIRKIVKNLGLDNFFVQVCGSPKKKHDWLKEILSLGGYLVIDSVFIGDALEDYRAAQTIGMDFILRKTPFGENLFKNYQGVSFSNFVGFEKVLEKL